MLMLFRRCHFAAQKKKKKVLPPSSAVLNWRTRMPLYPSALVHTYYPTSPMYSKSHASHCQSERTYITSTPFHTSYHCPSAVAIPPLSLRTYDCPCVHIMLMILRLCTSAARNINCNSSDFRRLWSYLPPVRTWLISALITTNTHSNPRYLDSA